MILKYEGRCRVCGASFEYVFLNWSESLPDELYVMCPFCCVVVVV